MLGKLFISDCHFTFIKGSYHITIFTLIFVSKTNISKSFFEHNEGIGFIYTENELLSGSNIV